jgi:hypothetical protein
MAPIPAPAATLASVVPTRTDATAAPSVSVEMPDPTEAVKAAIAEAARAAAQASTPVEAAQKAPTAPAAIAAVAVAPAAPALAPAPRAAVVEAVPAQQIDMEVAAEVAAVPPPAMAVAPPAARRSRGLVAATVAAVLVAAGFLALPTDRVKPVASDAAKVPMSADTGLLGLSSVALANGIVLQTVETANGTRAMVSVLPDGVATDLQIGDIIIVYAATGEVVDGAQAVNALLERETANGVATFGFAVQRDGKMAVGYIELPRLGQLDPALNEQDGEKKT